MHGSVWFTELAMVPGGSECDGCAQPEATRKVTAIVQHPLGYREFAHSHGTALYFGGLGREWWRWICAG